MFICMKNIDKCYSASLAMFLNIFYIAIFTTTISINKLSADTSSEWRNFETLMEENPFIVALLNKTFQYFCTGTIINKRTVLTSGSCVISDPRRVAVGYAVINKKISKRFTLRVAYTRLHTDYNFEMRAAEPNVSRMHSNLGLVYVTEPMLELFVSRAELGTYYASELQDMELTAIGYGKLNYQHVVGMQHQIYYQAPCANPRWYYCICGNEVSNSSKTYDKEFGNGGPVLFGDEVVGITAAAGGTLTLGPSGVKYNVFTVLGPYLSWIEKANLEASSWRRAISNPDKQRRNATTRTKSNLFLLLYILLVIIKLCN